MALLKANAISLHSQRLHVLTGAGTLTKSNPPRTRESPVPVSRNAVKISSARTMKRFP